MVSVGLPDRHYCYCMLDLSRLSDYEPVTARPPPPTDMSPHLSSPHLDPLLHSRLISSLAPCRGSAADGAACGRGYRRAAGPGTGGRDGGGHQRVPGEVPGGGAEAVACACGDQPQMTGAV